MSSSPNFPLAHMNLVTAGSPQSNLANSISFSCHSENPILSVVRKKIPSHFLASQILIYFSFFSGKLKFGQLAIFNFFVEKYICRFLLDCATITTIIKSANFKPLFQIGKTSGQIIILSNSINTLHTGFSASCIHDSIYIPPTPPLR